MNFRQTLFGIASSALLSLTPANAAQPQSQPAAQAIQIPTEGVTIYWGYQLENGVFAELRHNGKFRDSFNNNLTYFFPNQTPQDATTGYAQSSTGLSSTSSLNAVTQYHSTFRMPANERYEAEGAPLNGQDSHLSITCPVPAASKAEPVPLTAEQRTELSKRINNGSATLMGMPEVYERTFGYELQDGKFFLAFYEEGNWPNGQNRAFVGSPQTGWKELGNVQYSDSRERFHGFRTSEGDLAMAPPFDFQRKYKTTWQGVPVKRDLSEQDANKLAQELKKTPVGTSVRPRNFPTPCGALTS